MNTGALKYFTKISNGKWLKVRPNKNKLKLKKNQVNLGFFSTMTTQFKVKPPSVQSAKCPNFANFEKWQKFQVTSYTTTVKVEQQNKNTSSWEKKVNPSNTATYDQMVSEVDKRGFPGKRFGTLIIGNCGEVAHSMLLAALKMDLKVVVFATKGDEKSPLVRKARQLEKEGKGVVLPIGKMKDVNAQKQQITEYVKKHPNEKIAYFPGIGNGAEDWTLSEHCKKNKVIHMGPPIKTMQILASKGAYKTFCLNHKGGIPPIPGYFGKQDVKTLAKEAKKTGYPVMIKLVYGAGGQGIEEVHSESELLEKLPKVQKIGQSLFGNPEVTIEKLIKNPRHIEVNVIADTQGSLIAMVRCCSYQTKKHFKQFEVSAIPGVNISKTLYNRVKTDALQKARKLKITGSTTFEYLVSEKKTKTEEDEVYSMEGQGRKQQEGDVSSKQKGFNFNDTLLRIYQGYPLKKCLPTNLSDKWMVLNIRGHALNMTQVINKDDQTFQVSENGPIRVNFTPTENAELLTAVETGSELNYDNDPMIFKLVVSGKSLKEMYNNALSALEQLEISGISSDLTDFTPWALGRIIRINESHNRETEGEILERRTDDFPKLISKWIDLKEIEGRLGYDPNDPHSPHHH